jgi:hypothetical protein
MVRMVQPVPLLLLLARVRVVRAGAGATVDAASDVDAVADHGAWRVADAAIDIWSTGVQLGAGVSAVRHVRVGWEGGEGVVGGGDGDVEPG